MTIDEKARAIKILDKIREQAEFQATRDSAKPHTVTLLADDALWLGEKFVEFCCWDYASERGLVAGPNPSTIEPKKGAG